MIHGWVYVTVSSRYSNDIFRPIAVESLGPINASDRAVLSKLGRKLSGQPTYDTETSFLFPATLRSDSTLFVYTAALGRSIEGLKDHSGAAVPRGQVSRRGNNVPILSCVQSYTCPL